MSKPIRISFQSKFFYFLLACFSISTFVSAQTGTIRGFVYEKDGGEPVIFTNVYLKGTTIGSTTDVNGFYSIAKIPAGDYILLVTYLGYDSLSIPVSVGANEIITKKLQLSKNSTILPEIEISAESEAAKNDVRVSVTKITPKEIRQVPSVGGEADLAQYLQILPGAISTGDQGGQLYIRGGAPIQNKVLLDGMVIYNPFHSIGFFSVFDTDILRNVDVYTGGFGAEYGGRISSIMDITTRDGNKKRISGKISASPFSSKLLLEGPISRSKEDGQGSTSFILSGKTSYLDQTSKVFYKYADSLGLPFSFNDLYGKISMNAANGNKLNFFGFRFSDKVKYQHLSDLNWLSSGFGSNFVVIPSNTEVMINGNFAYSDYFISLAESDGKPRDSRINSFNMGLEFTYYPGRNEIKYGFDILGVRTDFNFYNGAGRHLQQQDNSTEVAGYLKFKKAGDKLIFEPSLRLNYYASLSEFSPEPRLGMKYNISQKFRLKFAGGYYTQNLISANSDKDVVNLFYGFLSGSEELPDEFNGKKVTSNLQKATHAVLGFEYDLTRRININVEGYQKNFTQLTNINRDKLFDDTEANADKDDLLKKDYILESGYARGVDFVFKYEYKKLYFWTVYSLGFVTRTDGKREYAPHFDRRHNVNFVCSYSFGKNGNWQVDLRWNYGSGFPFTPNAGFYEQVTFDNNINYDYTTANGEVSTIYGDINSKRLSDYHRLDITLKKRFILSKNTLLETFINVINAYNNKNNIFYFNRVTGQSIYQFPIIPSAGLSINF